MTTPTLGDPIEFPLATPRDEMDKVLQAVYEKLDCDFIDASTGETQRFFPVARRQWHLPRKTFTMGALLSVAEAAQALADAAKRRGASSCACFGGVCKCGAETLESALTAYRAATAKAAQDLSQ